MPKLGRRMFSQNFVLRGRLEADEWRAFLGACMTAMGMNAAGYPAAWRYPTDDGKGGHGMTICAPMTESFLVVDTWPDHDGAYLHISSCVRFDPSSLIAPVRSAGLEIGFVGALEMLRISA